VLGRALGGVGCAANEQREVIAVNDAPQVGADGGRDRKPRSDDADDITRASIMLSVATPPSHLKGESPSRVLSSASAPPANGVA